jgi:OmpA-OmpF porin, OOP family
MSRLSAACLALLACLVTAPAGGQNVSCGPIIETVIPLFFESGTRLSAQSRKNLEEIAEAAVRYEWRAIYLEGHADRLGSARSNLLLSRRRAETVKSILVRRGFPAGRIGIAAFGEDRPLVETADGVSEPQNRLVFIDTNPYPKPIDASCLPGGRR